METEIMDKQSFFDADYFMNGKTTGKSNYENYSWVPHLTLPMVSAIKKYLGIQDWDRVLDFGCSRGFVVKALRMIHVYAVGYDFSKWAIKHCDPDVRDFVSNQLSVEPMEYDFTIMKDVAEHIEPEQLKIIVKELIGATKKSLFFIVPLTNEDGGKYVCPRDEMDPSHVNRWTLTTWMQFFQGIDRRMSVGGSFYVPGIKEANTAYENSCGFFVLKRF